MCYKIQTLLALSFILITCEEKTDIDPPVVSLESNSTSFTQEGKLELTVQATDASGIANIEIYDNDTKLDDLVEQSNVFTKDLTWKDNGIHIFTAKATDKCSPPNTGISNKVVINVDIPRPDTKAPVVTLTATPLTPFVKAGVFTITATASDSSGIESIEIYEGDKRVGSKTSSPYLFERSITSVDNGTLTFTAKAKDKSSNANVGISNSISINVAIPVNDITPPTISLAANATTFTATGQLKLTATASDASGIAKVEFYQGSDLLGSVMTSPYIFTKNLTAANNGSLNFTAKAIDKAIPPNTSAPSNVVAVQVNIPVPDTTPPTVSLTANSQTFTSAGQLTITANATDASGISKVEIYQGSTLVASSTTTSCSFSKNITVSDNGSLSFTAKAYDKAMPANTGTSSIITVQVNISSTPGPSAGCNQGMSGSQSGIFQVKDGNNVTRNFEIATSSAYKNNQGAPIVFVLHGNGGDIANARSFGFMDAIQASGDAGIVIIPQGRDWQGWGVGWDETKNGYDMPFFDNMIAFVSNNYCVNTSRIFVTGFSWGGDMVNALTCFRGDKFRGVANFSGGEIMNPINTCTTSKYPASRFRYGTAFGNGGDGAYTLAAFKGVTNFYKIVLGAGNTPSPVSPSPCVQYPNTSQPFLECVDPGLGHASPSLNDAKETWTFWKNLP